MRGVGIAVLVFLLSACAAGVKEGKKQSIPLLDNFCEIQQSGPSQVLVGVDLQGKNVFMPSKLELGRYSGESGGAVVVVDLDSSTQLTRMYREVGMPEIVKRYASLCTDYGALYLYGEGVQVRFVEGGILLWEQNAGEAMLPTDLWIYLKKE